MIHDRRGSAMPMVLFGMAVAILIATLAWNRAWSRRTTSAHADIAWQAQLMAESGTACALQAALARAGSNNVPPPTSIPSATPVLPPKPLVNILDTADTACEFHRRPPGEMSWDEPAGTQILTIRATGTVMESGSPLTTVLRSIWGGNPPVDPFVPAISLWDPSPNPLFPAPDPKNGIARVNYKPASPGTENHKSGDLQQFIPASMASDTTIAVHRMASAFRSDDAHLGGESFTPQRPPPDRDSLVYTVGDVVFDAPWAGDPWNVGRPRTLFVEGRIELRGKLRMNGWKLFAKGQVVIQDDADVSGLDVFSAGGIRIADRARVSGQFLSAGSIQISDDARLLPPSFAACWPSKGRDSIPRFAMTDRSQAEGYVVVLGGSAELAISRGSIFRGVAVSNNILRNDGKIEGIAVSGRLDCGQGPRNCYNGTFARQRLPIDFAFPLGLPGNRGYRLLSWVTGE